MQNPRSPRASNILPQMPDFFQKTNAPLNKKNEQNPKHFHQQIFQQKTAIQSPRVFLPQQKHSRPSTPTFKHPPLEKVRSQEFIPTMILDNKDPIKINKADNQPLKQNPEPQPHYNKKYSDHANQKQPEHFRHTFGLNPINLKDKSTPLEQNHKVMKTRKQSQNYDITRFNKLYMAKSSADFTQQFSKVKNEFPKLKQQQTQRKMYQKPIPPATRKNSDNEKTLKKQIPSFIKQIKQIRGRNNTFDASSYNIKPTVSLNHFHFLKELGQGAFGKVFLARQKKSGFICAIKILQKQLVKAEDMAMQLIRELKIQLFINNPNIIKVYGYFSDQKNFYMIMEASLDGHLNEFFDQRKRKLVEKQVVGLMQQTCSAVGCLHQNLIIHRDVKPQNILLHEGVIKVSDFGWSVYRGTGEMRTTFCGTPIYLCPEMLQGDNYDESIDIWSLGIIIYELLFDSNPFKITKKQELLNIINSPIAFDPKTKVSQQAKDLIKKCLRKNSKERISIRQILAHPFFRVEGEGGGGIGEDAWRK